MFMRLLRRIALVALALGVGPAAAQVSGPTPAAAWVKLCVGDTACAVYNSIAVPGGVVRVYVHIVPGKPPTTEILLPPGVPGDSRFTWTIPGQVEDAYPVVNCNERRCRTLGELGDAGVKEMKRGGLLNIGYELNGKRFNIELTLKGFTAAFDGPAKYSEPAEVEAVLRALDEALEPHSAEASAAPPSAAAPATQHWTKYCHTHLPDCYTANWSVASNGEIVELAANDVVGQQALVLTLGTISPSKVESGSSYGILLNGEEVWHGKYGYCTQERLCSAMYPESGQNEALEQMRQGQVLTIIFQTKDGGQAEAKFALAGFGAAFEGAGVVIDNENFLAPLRAEAAQYEGTAPTEVSSVVPVAVAELAEGTPEAAAPVELAEGTAVPRDWIRACLANGVGAPPLCGTTAYLYSGDEVKATVSVLEPEGSIPASFSINLIGSDIVADAGFVMQVDQHIAVNFPIQKCDPIGLCTTRAKIPENWIEWLKQGAELTISFTGASKVESSIPITDFAEAFDGPMAAADEALEWRRAIIERAHRP